MSENISHISKLKLKVASYILECLRLRGLPTPGAFMGDVGSQARLRGLSIGIHYWKYQKDLI